MTSREKLAWQRVHVETMGNGDPGSNVAMFDRNCEEYDEDVSIMGYAGVGNEIAKKFLHHLSGHDADTKVLDLGAGTGLIGESLRRSSFNGQLYAIDASRGMLDIARNKQIYCKLIHQFVTFSKLPFPSSYFDGVISVGSLNPQSIDYRVTASVLDTLKSGGIFVASVKEIDENEEYIHGFTQHLCQLCENGIIKRIEIYKIEKYLTTNFEKSFVRSGPPISAKLFCYKKL